jgi:hypothetical protein
LKASTVIPPVVALVLVGSWVGAQRRSISVVEQQNAVLEQRMAAVRGSGQSEDSPVVGKLLRENVPVVKAPLNWKKVAEQLAESERGDLKASMRLQRRFHAMSAEEILTALDEIALLDISTASRNLLEQALLGPLAEKDPEAALTRFGEGLSDADGMVRWQLQHALARLGGQDPSKAVKWLDQQIAAGNLESRSLDGRNPLRAQFEGALVCSLISSDAQAVSARLAALPEEQRTEVMRHHLMGNLKEEDQKAFAEIVRAQLPEESGLQTISQVAARSVTRGGYPEVSAYLDRIEASPAERRSTAEQAANSKIQELSRKRGLSHEDLDSMRSWVETQAPGTADATTGKVLGFSDRNGGKLSFSQAAELALEYHERSGNDEVLASFLSVRGGRDHQDEIRVLAEKISDEKRREEILKQLK